MTIKKWIFIFLLLIFLVIVWTFKNFNYNYNYKVGEVIDSFNNVAVYYNGGVSNVVERNTAANGYNLGLKYQCVEFVKRYYYEYLNHEMPDSYGNAKDFFDKEIIDGAINPKRDLIQYKNNGSTRPKVNDLLIFSASISNIYGHVAIISKVADDEIEIIQQNPGPFKSSRAVFSLKKQDGKYMIENKRILGWLRKNQQKEQMNR